MMKNVLVALLVLVAVVSAAHLEAHGWKHAGRAHKHDQHTVIIAVTGAYNALATCDSALMARADPDSELYGKHMSVREIRRLMADESNLAKVEQWLRAAKVSFTTAPTGDFVEVTDSVGKLERLFDVKMHAYTHEQSKVHAVRAHSAPRMPMSVLAVVDAVSNLDDALPDLEQRAMGRAHIAAVTPEASGQTTPGFLSQYYGINGRATHASAGVYEALGQSFAQSDLDQFCQQQRLETTHINVTGPNSPSECSFNANACGEFTLDVEYLVGLAQNASVDAYSVPQNVQDIFLNWANYVSQNGFKTEVWSISYGGVAEDEADTNKARFSQDVCKAGLAGVSVFVASGDDGVQGAQNCLQRSCQFSSSFPATVPYVTAVGATQGPEFGQAEVVCSSTNQGVITSGSSVSSYFDTPSYQQSQVSAYLSSGVQLPPAQQFRKNGRFAPDVAFLGAQYITIIGGQPLTLYGTSASSPSFASIVVLINAERKANGKGTLGFVNPALYKAPSSSFNDITVGNTGCCSSSRGGCECGSNGNSFGFHAASGWDAASGLGSPKFAPLKSYLSAL